MRANIVQRFGGQARAVGCVFEELTPGAAWAAWGCLGVGMDTPCQPPHAHPRLLSTKPDSSSNSAAAQDELGEGRPGPPIPPPSAQPPLTASQRALLASRTSAVLNFGPEPARDATGGGPDPTAFNPLLAAVASAHPEFGAQVARSLRRQRAQEDEEAGGGAAAAAARALEAERAERAEREAREAEVDALMDEDLTSRLAGLGRKGADARPPSPAPPPATSPSSPSLPPPSPPSFFIRTPGEADLATPSPPTATTPPSTSASWTEALPADPAHPYAPTPDAEYSRWVRACLTG